MATVPLRFSNRLGFPMLEVQSVTTNGTVTTLNFNDHPQRKAFFYGGFWVKVPAITSTSAISAYTIEFAKLGVSGSNLPLYLYNGSSATVGDMATTGPGILLCF